MRGYWFNVLRWPLSAQFLLLAAIDTHLALYLSRHQLAVQTLSALLLAVLLFLLAIWRFDQEQTQARPLLLHWDRYDTWAIVLLLALAFALRGFNLEHAPLTAHNDEAVIGVRTLALLGKPLAPFWLPDEWSLTKVWYYAQAPFVWFFGRTLTAVRIFSAIGGTLSVLSAYLLGRLLFTQRVALGAAFLLATYHLHIHFSRISVPNIFDPLWGTLIFSCLTIGLTTQRRFWFAVAGVIMGIALNFYPGARLFIPLIGLVAVAWPLIQRQPWRSWLGPDTWFPWLLVLLGCLITAAPYIQAAWAEPYFFLIRFTSQQVTPEFIEQTVQTQGWTPVHFWWEQFRHASLSFFLTPLPGTQGFYDNEVPLMTGLGAWLLAAGALLALWRWRQWPYPLLIGWYLLTVLAGGILLVEPAAPQRFVTLTGVVCLLITLGLEQVRHWLFFRWPNWRWAIEIVVLALYLQLSVTSLYRYYVYYLGNPAHYAPYNSQAGTTLAFYLRGQPPGTEVWFVGKGTHSVLHSHIPQYLAPQSHRHDWTAFPQIAGEPQPDSVPRTNAITPTLFITSFRQAEERAALQERYPGGIEEPLYWPGLRDPLLVVYRLPLP